MTSPRLSGCGENTAGTGDLRTSCAFGGGRGGIERFSGEGGSGTRAAVFNEFIGEAGISSFANRFVGDGGGLARMVSSAP